MARISLRLPSELGRTRGEEGGRAPAADRGSEDGHRRVSRQETGDEPQIQRWLECWAERGK